jgi:hypothetical protein
MTAEPYTTQLAAGSGIIEESRALLSLWDGGMNPTDLFQTALQSGRFPTMSARRLRNLVAEGFAPRYLDDDARPAALLKRLQGVLSSREVDQLMFLFTCRANRILADFVREAYWPAYSAGRDVISNEETREFVTRANQDGKTVSPWSDSMIERVAGYMTRALADFGLLEPGIKKARRIIPYRIEPRIATVLAYDLHFAGHGDNRVINHPDWQMFGLEPTDVINEMKRLSRKGLFIIQHAGDVTRIGWQHDTMEELADALAEV